jgi:uncharacterized protein (TIGR02466 family)
MSSPCPDPGAPQAIAVQRLFTTPLATLAFPDAETLNAALRAVILQREADQPSLQHSNEGGWQSSHDFADWAGEPGQRLLAFAVDMATQLTAVHAPEHGLVEPTFSWRYEAWANVNRSGHANALHGHPGAFWSGIYWVDDGGRDGYPEIGGDLELLDPRGLMPSMHNPSLRMRIEGCLTAGYPTVVPPRSGILMMFPSWLAHAVRRYDGTRPRISVAFNFTA